MKRLTILLAAAAIATGSLMAKDIRTVTVTTDPPMHCANCEAKIKNQLKFEKGIKKIDTNVADQEVTVTYDADKTSVKEIIKSLAKIKYNARKVTPAAKQK